MLTIEDIVALSENVNVHVNWHQQRHEDKGQWGKGETDDVILYMKNIVSQEDLDITILHEFVHARDNCLLEREFVPESEVENEAVETYKNAPEVLSIIKQFYHLEKLDSHDWSK